MSKATTTAPGTQLVSVACPCGVKHLFPANHYDRFIVSCGRRYWALQPKRNGELKLFPWPGENLTRREMIEKGLTE